MCAPACQRSCLRGAPASRPQSTRCTFSGDFRLNRLAEPMLKGGLLWQWAWADVEHECTASEFLSPSVSRTVHFLTGTNALKPPCEQCHQRSLLGGRPALALGTGLHTARGVLRCPALPCAAASAEPAPELAASVTDAASRLCQHQACPSSS